MIPNFSNEDLGFFRLRH